MDAMALNVEEWEELKRTGKVDFIPKSIFTDIENYFYC